MPGFQYRDEAESFPTRLRERMAEFGLELHAEKTRLIEFGRFRKREGAGKPETFNFLGFTHICSTIHKSGKLTVKRKTAGKRMTAKLRDVAAKLRSAELAINVAAAQSAQPVDVGALPDSD